MSRRNEKLLDVPCSFLYDSGLQVTFLSLSSEESKFIPAKRPQSFITFSSPIFSQQCSAWIRSKAPGGGGAMCHSITDYCKCFTLKGSRLQQLWQSHTMASILWALPGRPTDQLKMKHNVQPLNHPGDGLVWSQESVIILENKGSWIDMLTSLSWWKAGRVGFHSCQLREGSAPFVHLNSFHGTDGLYPIWIKMMPGQEQTWTSSDSVS